MVFSLLPIQFSLFSSNGLKYILNLTSSLRKMFLLLSQIPAQCGGFLLGWLKVGLRRETCIRESSRYQDSHAAWQWRVENQSKDAGLLDLKTMATFTIESVPGILFNRIETKILTCLWSDI